MTFGQFFPKPPGTSSRFRSQTRHRIHRTETGRIRHRAKRYDYEVLFGKVDLNRMTILFTEYARYLVTVSDRVEAKIHYGDVEHELHTSLLQPFSKRPNERVVLVVDRTHDSCERAEPRNHVGKAHEITLELECAMPRLEGKCSAPHEPEIGLEEGGLELVRDAASSQQIFRLKFQALNCQDMLLA